jgi:translation initiation factor 1A
MPGGPKRRSKKRPDKGLSNDMPLKDDSNDQCYATTTKMLGNSRIMVKCEDGNERMCRIRGSMGRKQWIVVGDAVLVSLRGLQDKGDVLYRYTDQESHRLKRIGEYCAVGGEGNQCDDDGTGDTEFVDFLQGSDDERAS